MVYIYAIYNSACVCVRMRAYARDRDILYAMVLLYYPIIDYYKEYYPRLL